MNTVLLNGLVLHRRPYRETSMLVDFFTREQGCVSAVCKGVRGTKSASRNDKKSLLQPFQPVQLTLSGRHQLKTLGQLEANGKMFNFSGTLLFSALYLNELLNRILPNGVSYPEIFDLYLASLLRLDAREAVEEVLREFEIQLLAYLGYSFSWHTDCQSGQTLVAGQHYEFVMERGFCHIPEQFRSQNAFSAENLLKVARYEWDQASLSSAKRVLRMAFRPILGDKPLKSRELFKTLEQQK